LLGYLLASTAGGLTQLVLKLHVTGGHIRRLGYDAELDSMLSVGQNNRRPYRKLGCQKSTPLAAS